MSRKIVKPKQNKDWPIVVYIAAEGIIKTQPHQYHWLTAIAGGILGIGVGWVWYRFRGDVF